MCLGPGQIVAGIYKRGSLHVLLLTLWIQDLGRWGDEAYDLISGFSAPGKP